MTLDDVRRLIDLDRDALKASGVTALYVFGSFARGDSRSESDVDIIVDYDPVTFDLIDLSGVQQRLAARLDAKVDVVDLQGAASAGSR